MGFSENVSALKNAYETDDVLKDCENSIKKRKLDLGRNLGILAGSIDEIVSSLGKDVIILDRSGFNISEREFDLYAVKRDDGNFEVVAYSCPDCGIVLSSPQEISYRGGSAIDYKCKVCDLPLAHKF
ncbi:MAG: hypothetical protein ACLFPQ_04800 [Candidatus Woesearchaeota archaeon]